MTKEEYKSLLANATVFYNSAKLLTRACNTELLRGNNNDAASYFISSVINYAFSDVWWLAWRAK